MEEANFIKRLKRGSRKYKGKFPIKFFNCGEVGHYASKFPYKKENHERYLKEKKKHKKIKEGKTQAEEFLS